MTISHSLSKWCTAVQVKTMYAYNISPFRGQTERCDVKETSNIKLHIIIRCSDLSKFTWGMKTILPLDDWCLTMGLQIVQVSVKDLPQVFSFFMSVWTGVIMEAPPLMIERFHHNVEVNNSVMVWKTTPSNAVEHDALGNLTKAWHRCFSVVLNSKIW